MEDTSLMTGTDASAEHIWKNICSPTRFVLLFERERQSVGSFGMLSCVQAQEKLMENVRDLAVFLECKHKLGIKKTLQFAAIWLFLGGGYHRYKLKSVW